MRLTTSLWAAAALLGLLTLYPAGAARAGPPQRWRIDRAHSSVEFEVLHLGLTTVRGEFGAYDATVSADAESGRLEAFDALVVVGSLDTGRQQRDDFLRGRSCFHVLGFPVARLVSREVRWEGDRLTVEAMLTIRGITRPVVLEGVRRGPRLVDVGQGKRLRVGYQLTAPIQRTDFELCTQTLGSTSRTLPETAALQLEILLEQVP